MKYPDGDSFTISESLGEYATDKYDMVNMRNMEKEIDTMARKKIIAGNWKMNKTPSEAVALGKDVKATW